MAEVKKAKRKRKARVKRDAAPQVAGSDSLRAEREPFGSFRSRLHIPHKDPAYHYHWHRSDELHRAIAGGYAQITRREAGRVLPDELAAEGNRADDFLTEKGGVGENGLYRLCAMRIMRPLWEEDNRKRDARADAVDMAISRPELHAGKVVDNVYGDLSSIQVKTGDGAEL